MYTTFIHLYNTHLKVSFICP